MPEPNEHITGTALLRSGARIEVDEYLYVPPGTSGAELVEQLRRKDAWKALDVESFDIARRQL